MLDAIGRGLIMPRVWFVCRLLVLSALLGALIGSEPAHASPVTFNFSGTITGGGAGRSGCERLWRFPVVRSGSRLGSDEAAPPRRLPTARHGLRCDRGPGLFRPQWRLARRGFDVPAWRVDTRRQPP
jgi:hypothetical protein